MRNREQNNFSTRPHYVEWMNLCVRVLFTQFLSVALSFASSAYYIDRFITSLNPFFPLFFFSSSALSTFNLIPPPKIKCPLDYCNSPETSGMYLFFYDRNNTIER